MLRKEFEDMKVEGISFTTGTIIIKESLFFHPDHSVKQTAFPLIEKLGGFFLNVMQDNAMRHHIDLVLVGGVYTITDNPEHNRRMRMLQFKAEFILDAMFRAKPDLEKKYGNYFAATYLGLGPDDINSDSLVFSIIPSEQVHIEVLQKLRKYVH